MERHFDEIKATIERRAAELGKPPWDSPLRAKRYVHNPDGTLREISADDEWNKYEWLNVTSINDPGDGHVYFRGLLRTIPR